MRRASLVLVAVGGATLFACGGGSSGDDTTGADANGGDGPPSIVAPDGGGPPDTTLTDGKASGDTAIPPGDAAVDAPVIFDANPPGDASVCNPVIADDNTGVYALAVGGTSASNCGARSGPCSTVTMALAHAAMNGKSTVYVGPGTYNETVTLGNGIALRGGWVVLGNAWQQNCDATSTILQTTTSDRVVIATNLASTTPLDTLTINNGTAAGAGESLYGIFSTASRLVLQNVKVTVNGGGTGTNGATGGGGGAGGGCANAQASTGAMGAMGSAGSAGAGAQFSGSGVAPPPAAGTGGQGATGENGTAPTAGQCITGVPGCDPTGSSCLPGSQSYCPTTPGTIGCGGAPGNGGTGGSGGGSSIGLYAWGGVITTASGVLSAGSGGAGGNGAAGGAGGPGSAGGSSQIDVIVACSTKIINGNPVCIQTPMTESANNAGGTGGTGGAGGTGGGGAGGDTFSYYSGNGATVTVSGTTLVFGAAGPGGAGGTTGPAGTAAEHN